MRSQESLHREAVDAINRFYRNLHKMADAVWKEHHPGARPSHTRFEGFTTEDIVCWYDSEATTDPGKQGMTRTMLLGMNDEGYFVDFYVNWSQWGRDEGDYELNGLAYQGDDDENIVPIDRKHWED
jgi:hypothetical protein